MKKLIIVIMIIIINNNKYKLNIEHINTKYE